VSIVFSHRNHESISHFFGSRNQVESNKGNLIKAFDKEATRIGSRAKFLKNRHFEGQKWTFSKDLVDFPK
jgi:hypothetical protein